MAKSIKLSNKVYLSDECVVHDKTSLSDLLYDSDWQELELADGITAISGAEPKIRRIGNIVYINGRISFTASSGVVTLFNIPFGFRPSMYFYTISPSTSKYVGRTGYSTSGNVWCDYICNLASTSAITSGTVAWYDITTSYTCDD